MKSLIKSAVRLVTGEYSAYAILACRPDPNAPVEAGGYQIKVVEEADIRNSPDELMRTQAVYAGEGAVAYACMDGERIVGLCFYWHGARYLTRNFWPLRDGEAKLVQIITLPEMRGKGIAGQLIGFSSADMGQRGFKRCFARVWHSNTPSLRAFAKAGWERCAFVVEFNPLRRAKPMRLQFKVAG